MQPWRLYICALVAFCSITYAEANWSYAGNGPAEWAENYPDCGLDQQSPIILDTFKATWTWPSVLKKLEASVVLHDYDIPANGTFTNTGHTVYLTLDYSDPEATPRVLVTSNGSVATAYFESLSFHWPAEHTYTFQSFPLVLEVQMKHREPVKNITVILAYTFFECEKSTLPGLVEVAAAVRQLTNAGDHVPVTAFALQGLMPGSTTRVGQVLATCDFFAYMGSLTAPPCTEGVAWAVGVWPQCITRQQMSAFEGVLDANGQPMSGNVRPLQPANNRTVLLAPCKDPWQ